MKMCEGMLTFQLFRAVKLIVHLTASKAALSEAYVLECCQESSALLAKKERITF